MRKQCYREDDTSDNYYILITRENLYQLPYSVDAVFELHKATSRFKHTYNRTFQKCAHIDSKIYFSREQFFTILPESKTENTPVRYSRKKLSAYYLQKKNPDKIIKRIRIGS